MSIKQIGFSLGVAGVLSVGLTGFAFASHKSLVLGESITPASIEMPPTSGGPGFVLPDSPLFVLDEVKQALRVAFSVTAESRAKVYADVANERLAELRFMLARNNEKGIRVALNGIADNFENASRELSEAQLRGKNVSQTAKQIVNLAREHQKVLDMLASQSTGVLQKQVVVVQESLLASKVIIEDSLESKDLAEEIRYDLERQGVVLGETVEVTPPPATLAPVAPSKNSETAPLKP